MTQASIKTILIVFLYSQFLPSTTDTLSVNCVFFIYYLVGFWKKKAKIYILIDSKSEINAMISTYISELGF